MKLIFYVFLVSIIRQATNNNHQILEPLACQCISIGVIDDLMRIGIFSREILAVR